jgi:hypothetical protein
MTWRHDEPDDREIRRALASLPRERAAEGFTERVLCRLDEAPRSSTRESLQHFLGRPFRGQPALAGTILALALVAVLFVAGRVWTARDVDRDGGGSGESAPISAQTDVASVDSPAGSVAHPQTPTQAQPASSRQGHTEVTAQLDELRREYTRLTRDLRDLRELAEGSQVIYVGGDESLDFVLELNPEPPPETGSSARPAGLPSSGPGARNFL